MKKIFILIALAICLSSCGDDWRIKEFYIDNQTEDTIRIVFNEIHPFYNYMDPDNLIYLPHQKKIFFDLEVRKPLGGDIGCKYSGIKKEDIEIYISSGRKLVKEFTDFESNWDCEKDKYGNITRTFKINEEDLE